MTSFLERSLAGRPDRSPLLRFVQENGHAPSRRLGRGARAARTRGRTPHRGAGSAKRSRIADSLIAAGEKDSESLAQKARALGGLGRGEEAIAVFEEAILADYENCENHLHFATTSCGSEKRGARRRSSSKRSVSARGSTTPLIYRNLAVAGIKLDKLDLARQYVEEGLEARRGRSLSERAQGDARRPREPARRGKSLREIPMARGGDGRVPRPVRASSHQRGAAESKRRTFCRRPRG